MKRGLGLLSRLWRLLPGAQTHPTAGQAHASLRFGAIPYRRLGAEIQFLMITSRATGRWIFPKGHLVDGLTSAETAAEEAFEEAGVRGLIGGNPVGHYYAIKAGPGGGTRLSIQMFPLEVTEQFEDWPEKHQRRRAWSTLVEVQRHISEPALVKMAEKIAGDDQI